ncbi:PQQ-dependent sugar dehydrogenase [Yunchengibacter salinarum]|uniref:PQQ-dependent sugar dehydrogenase n=1 Tax=Yunchengibacter salinarum TaxID=3133399 RepID=UPI0035B57C90
MTRMKNGIKGALAAIMGAGIGLTGVQAQVSGVPDDAARNPDTGVRLAPGFEATVFADGIGRARHMAVSADGWVYAALMRPTEDGFGAVALKDTDGDGKADRTEYFAPGLSGTGMRLHDGALYYGDDTSIVRFSLADGPVPSGAGTVVMDGFPEQRAHAAKSLAFDGEGMLYVNVGAPSNACMTETRVKGSPGARPCPDLELQASVWMLNPDGDDQTFPDDAVRHSTGHRNAVALEWNHQADGLYLVQHGRDQLHQFFPDIYSVAESAELPAEEFHRVDRGDDLGWPFSYYDHRKGSRMVMPEYGGDGDTVSDHGKKPLLGFPGHWAPNGLLFRQTGAWPDGWRTGAFIAFHGSWNRSPVQEGYRIVYVPMDADGTVTGDWVTFADGFAGEDKVTSPRQAEHRPTGLTEGPDGAMYVSSLMSGGRIWRVTHAQD